MTNKKDNWYSFAIDLRKEWSQLKEEIRIKWGIENHYKKNILEVIADFLVSCYVIIALISIFIIKTPPYILRIHKEFKERHEFNYDLAKNIMLIMLYLSLVISMITVTLTSDYPMLIINFIITAIFVTLLEVSDFELNNCKDYIFKDYTPLQKMRYLLFGNMIACSLLSIYSIMMICTESIIPFVFFFTVGIMCLLSSIGMELKRSCILISLFYIFMVITTTALIIYISGDSFESWFMAKEAKGG
ncbi:MAG: hypothetical protein ACOCQD_03325 [archaeon]